MITKREFGIVGLGRMGGNLARQALEKGMRVVGFTQGGAPADLVEAGGPGAGHFTKLVHNGIEFGMLQAIGEGIDLLGHYRERLDIAEVLRCWRHGSVIRSWLIDLLEAAYRSEDATKIPSYVEDTGEVNWLVNDALHMEVPVPVIAQAVMQLFASRDDKKSWARAIAMMRHGFGGHPYGPSEPIRQEREEGRVGEFFKESNSSAEKAGRTRRSSRHQKHRRIRAHA